MGWLSLSCFSHRSMVLWRGLKRGSQRWRSQAGLFAYEVDENAYSLIYSLTRRLWLLLRKSHHHPTGKFFDLEIDLGVILQGFADANEAAAIFFYRVDEVESLSHQLVAQAGAVIVGLDVGNADAAVKGARVRHVLHSCRYTGCDRSGWLR